MRNNLIVYFANCCSINTYAEQIKSQRQCPKINSWRTTQQQGSRFKVLLLARQLNHPAMRAQLHLPDLISPGLWAHAHNYTCRRTHKLQSSAGYNNTHSWHFCSLLYNLSVLASKDHMICGRAGIAQWLERRTRDWKVAGSSPCRNVWRV